MTTELGSMIRLKAPSMTKPHVQTGRSIDSSGRVSLPIQMREAHELEKGSPVAIELCYDGILIRPVEAKPEPDGSAFHGFCAGCNEPVRWSEPIVAMHGVVAHQKPECAAEILPGLLRLAAKLASTVHEAAPAKVSAHCEGGTDGR